MLCVYSRFFINCCISVTNIVMGFKTPFIDGIGKRYYINKYWLWFYLMVLAWFLTVDVAALLLLAKKRQQAALLARKKRLINLVPKKQSETSTTIHFPWMANIILQKKWQQMTIKPTALLKRLLFITTHATLPIM